MKTIKHLLFASILLGVAGSAQATTINFKALAEPGGGIGESAWDPLTFSFSDVDLTITATKNGQSAYAYLDSGNAGLGVCGSLFNVNSANKITNSRTNLCNPGNDDNTTVGESLSFVFSNNVVIDRIWFNNNHDGDRNLLGDTINIGGVAYTFTNGGYLVDSFTTSPFSVAGGSIFDISFNNEQFYVSKIDFRAVPEPVTISLLGMGLLGLAFFGRRRAK